MANFTKKAILDEFEQMLAEMPFQKITVTALVQRLKISPNTFYYHFQDIYALLDSWLSEKKKYFMRQTGNVADLRESMKLLFQTFRSNDVLVYHLSESISRERLEYYIMVTARQQLRIFLQEKTKNLQLYEAALDGMTEIFCFTIVGMTLEFIWKHMDMDIDSLTDTVCTMFEKAFTPGEL